MKNFFVIDAGDGSFIRTIEAKDISEACDITEDFETVLRVCDAKTLLKNLSTFLLNSGVE